jgi:hypothetical protein
MGMTAAASLSELAARTALSVGLSCLRTVPFTDMYVIDDGQLSARVGAYPLAGDTGIDYDETWLPPWYIPFTFNTEGATETVKVQIATVSESEIYTSGEMRATAHVLRFWCAAYVAFRISLAPGQYKWRYCTKVGDEFGPYGEWQALGTVPDYDLPSMCSMAFAAPLVADPGNVYIYIACYGAVRIYFEVTDPEGLIISNGYALVSPWPPPDGPQVRKAYYVRTSVNVYAPGLYTWRCRGWNQKGYSEWVTGTPITCRGPAPPQPIYPDRPGLIAPLSDAMIPCPEEGIRFSWAAAAHAQTYQFTLYDAVSARVLFDHSGTMGYREIIAQGLPTGRYIWFVTAVDATGLLKTDSEYRAVRIM